MRLALLLLVAFVGVRCDWPGPQRLLKGHAGPVAAIAWSPDGTKLACGGRGSAKELRIWEVATSRELQAIREGYFRESVWSPDGSRISFIDNESAVQVLDVTSGAKLHRFKGRSKDRLFSISWSPDGKSIATGSYGRHSPAIWKQRLVSEVAIRNSATGKKRLTITSQRDWGPVRFLGWSPDGRKLAGIYKGVGDFFYPVFRVLDTESGKEAYVLEGKREGGLDLAWSPDGSRLAGCIYPDSVRVWDAGSGKLLQVLKGKGARLTWSRDGKRLACGKQMWDAGSGKEIFSVPDHDYSHLSWSPDGDRVATSGQYESWLGTSGMIWVWEIPSGKIVFRIKRSKDWRYSHHMAWSPDGTRLATSGSSNMKIWSIPR